MNVIFARNLNALGPVANERFEEEAIHLVHVRVLEIVAEVEPFTMENLPIARDDVLGFGFESDYDVQI